MRFAELLAEQQVAFESLPHPLAFTAQKLAKYLRVPGSRVAKSVLLKGPTGHLLAVLPATHRVDTERLSRLLDGPVRVTAGREVALVFCDCEWGVVPPFGTLYGLCTLLEETITPDTPLVFETHTHVQAVRLLCRDFERLERPRRLRFARRDGPGAPRSPQARG
jgi:Ala-tRNA(Pro) deacylase